MDNADSPAVRLHKEKPRIFWGKVVWTLIQQGWNPPIPSTTIMNRILDDIGLQATERHWKYYPPTNELSLPQKETLAYIAMGMTYGQIGKELNRSPETIKEHAKTIYSKLGAKNAANAVYIALKQGIIS